VAESGVLGYVEGPSNAASGLCEASSGGFLPRSGPDAKKPPASPGAVHSKVWTHQARMMGTPFSVSSSGEPLLTS
jgi:hypothetical protein